MSTTESSTNFALASSQSPVKMSEVTIPSQLKFLMLNVKAVMNTQLNVDKYLLWKSQVLKLFTANGFEGYLDGSTPKPAKNIVSESRQITPNPQYLTWTLIDQNLAAALYSIISPSLLPYILNLDTCADIWITIERILQSTNRSRLLQLKSELHHISTRDKTVMQYLSDIKGKCDAIASSGTPLDPEDIIMYTLNGLPPAHQPFKTAIRTQLQQIHLDDFYALLCSEELNIAAENDQETQLLPLADPQLALAANRGRGRFRSNPNRGRGHYNTAAPTSTITQNRLPARSTNAYIECQICRKLGHSAFKCWHRANLQYQPQNPSAFVASSASENSDWVLDSGLTSHLTSDLNLIHQPHTYNGNQQVQIGNGDMLPITHAGQGLLPTPQRFDEQSHTSPRSLPSRPL
ncbi:Retrovirus-related Pol polyprotein from transposon TNT 1-94 [Dendrobium catenatum]|uniref:Retrovirus-related Pol polyprotein from transposon TNT 1-94 n=1 Tax=Dendrobium catenatum TaxID=906689 RepID=A0A2I0X9W5_9ASPA|nr:Retrovirus-related Pol polyprotein from transposon TNT 1-94 [Dendrobium catenatum]